MWPGAAYIKMNGENFVTYRRLEEKYRCLSVDFVYTTRPAGTAVAFRPYNLRSTISEFLNEKRYIDNQ